MGELLKRKHSRTKPTGESVIQLGEYEYENSYDKITILIKYPTENIASYTA